MEPVAAPDRIPPDAPTSEEPPLTRDEVRLVVRAKLAQVRACFDEGLALDPTLGGLIELRFTITAEGRVRDASLVVDGLSEKRVGECLLERVATWQFPRPRGGAELTVEYPFNFTSEEALRAAGLPRVEGTLKPAAVGAVFDAHRDELDRCLSDTRSPPGSIGVAFTIDDGGTVTKIVSYASTLAEPAARCVVRTIASWSFPPAAAGDEARVNHDLAW